VNSYEQMTAREVLAMHDAGKIKCYSDDPAERYDVQKMLAEQLRALIHPVTNEHEPDKYKVDPDGTPHGPHLKWVIELRVDPLWVADGFDLSNSIEPESTWLTALQVAEALASMLRYTTDGESGITVTAAPDPELLAYLRGEAPRKLHGEKP